MTAATAAAPGRDISLDGMRFVAMLFVITIHVSAKGFGNFAAHWWAVNLYESVSRIAVPLFFMVSGALLLPRQHSVPSIANRLWRVGLPLVAWSVIYLLWLDHAGQQHEDWPLRILQAPVMGHLWYLYTLIGAYLFLPVMSGFYQANPARVQLFCLFFWFIGASVVPLEVALTGREHVGISWAFLSLYAGYMVAGALAYRRLTPGPALVRCAWAVWAGTVVAVAGLTWWQCHRLARPDETFYVYSNPLVLIGAIAAFIALRDLFGRPMPALARQVLTQFGKVSFGVYLMHVLALFYLDSMGYDYHFINPWLGIPCLTLFVTLGCSLLVALMQRIPLLRLIVPA
jgi:surface polysaccharide O-acyltransferase-like enzyme